MNRPAPSSEARRGPTPTLSLETARATPSRASPQPLFPTRNQKVNVEVGVGSGGGVGAAAFLADFFFRGAAFFVAFRLAGFRAFADFLFLADLRAALFFLAAITYFFFLVFFFVVFFAVFFALFFAICASLGGKPSTGLLLFSTLRQ